MANKVRNFAFHLNEGWFELPTNAAVAIVPATLDAADAAELAERHGYDVLLVREGGRTIGVFFRDHVRRILGDHYFVVTNNIYVDPATPLSTIIRALDAACVDFHSERINTDVRTCPYGHVTDGDPCADHRVATQPYPRP